MSQTRAAAAAWAAAKEGPCESPDRAEAGGPAMRLGEREGRGAAWTDGGQGGCGTVTWGGERMGEGARESAR
jgi:hypothetical protein